MAGVCTSFHNVRLEKDVCDGLLKASFKHPEICSVVGCRVTRLSTGHGAVLSLQFSAAPGSCKICDCTYPHHRYDHSQRISLANCGLT